MEKEHRKGKRFGALDAGADTLALTRLTTHEDVTALLALFTEIARQEGWQPGEALNVIPEHAVLFALSDQDVLVGGLQIVMPSPTGILPCQSVWPDTTLPPSAAHVTIIGIQAAYRGNIELFWRLCQVVWCFCAKEGVEAVVLEATPRMLALYRRIGLPLEIVGGLRTHWGEPCYLASVDMVTVAGSVVMRARQSGLLRRLVFSALQPGSQPAIVE